MTASSEKNGPPIKENRLSPLSEAAALPEFWSQKIVAKANGQLLKVAKGIGATNWHKHDDQDEAFYVLNGQLIIDLRDRSIVLDQGELFVVPRGVEHRPRSDREVHILVCGPSITSTPDGGKPGWS